MDRSKKISLVSELRTIFETSILVVVARHDGLNMAETTALRLKMREEGARFRVVKNRLAQIALAGTAYETISTLLKGPTAIAYSRDPVAAARVAVSQAKELGKLEILGGALEGRELGVDGVKALASLPSLDESRAKIVGLLNAPSAQIARIINVPGSQLARLLSMRPDQNQAA